MRPAKTRRNAQKNSLNEILHALTPMVLLFAWIATLKVGSDIRAMLRGPVDTTDVSFRLKELTTQTDPQNSWLTPFSLLTPYKHVTYNVSMLHENKVVQSGLNSVRYIPGYKNSRERAIYFMLQEQVLPWNEIVNFSDPQQNPGDADDADTLQFKASVSTEKSPTPIKLPRR